MPGNSVSPDSSLRTRFRRISSFTGTAFTPDLLSSPSVRAWVIVWSPPPRPVWSSFGAAAQGRLGGQGLAPDVVREPVEVVLQDGAVGLRLGDAVAVAGVDDHGGGHALVAQSAVELVRVGDRNPPVVLAVLDQRRRLRLLDIGHG